MKSGSFDVKTRSERTSLLAAADGPLPPRPSAPTPRVVIPTVWAWQNLHRSTSAASSLAPSLRFRET